MVVVVAVAEDPRRDCGEMQRCRDAQESHLPYLARRPVKRPSTFYIPYLNFVGSRLLIPRDRDYCHPKSPPGPKASPPSFRSRVG